MTGARRRASVYAQETVDGQWIWWITAANHASIARSCRKYTTERSAIYAALDVASLGAIDVDERNLR